MLRGAGSGPLKRVTCLKSQVATICLLAIRQVSRRGQVLLSPGVLAAVMEAVSPPAEPIQVPLPWTLREEGRCFQLIEGEMVRGGSGEGGRKGKSTKDVRLPALAAAV